MGLSSALYSGTSGLNAHGEKMSVIGNNISNVNTVGFKSSRMDFEDAISQEITTASGTDQVGRGVAIGAVMNDFSQGSMQSTNNSTDLAIGGDGFFIVSPQGEERELYTRAGNFRFNKEGYLVDPHGYVVQGWEVRQEEVAQEGADNDQNVGVETVGSPRNIQLENFQSPPEATSKVNVVNNLDNRSEASSTVDLSDANATPMFAMFQQWDASEATGDPNNPIGDTQYTYQNTIEVYDESGDAHDLTIYYDPVQEDMQTDAGESHWEYMVTVNPEEDGRLFWDDTSIMSDTQKKGVLMIGNLTFDSSGTLENVSSFTLNDDDTSASGVSFVSTSSADLENWRSANFRNGLPIATANFTGKDNSDTTNQDEDVTPIPDPAPDPNNIEINFGLMSSNGDWTGGASDASLVEGTSDSAPSDLLMEEADILGVSTTSYSSSSTTIQQSQDGYPSGSLQNITVDRDGVLSASYSNGQNLNLYVLTLADFNNPQGLRREGGNLFSWTRESGQALTGLPGTEGLGSIASKSLEQSNVDMAQEFVNMIITQKGFQANSRTITTTDQMLQEVVNLKR